MEVIGFVPPGQAFFLEAAVDDVLTFTDAERAHVYGCTILEERYRAG